ncbi:MAG: hypothetical protein NC342_09330 [Pseudoflavonifractor sp.]|nr:hypothetical protein [Alloprevotella sp.]MCM1117721.1 hypothetical protein [Pseudoflavonifractor sp.]
MENAVFESAAQAYGEWAPFRQQRERYINYTFGRQWSDRVSGLDGRIVTEEEFTLQMGKKPLSNNLIRQMVKTVTGHFRRRLEEERPERGSLRGSEAGERNMIDELDCRMMEEFLISGCACQRVVSERRPGGSGVWIDNVDPSRLIVNRYSDPRGGDIEMIGMVHDMSFGELAARMAPEGGDRIVRLRQQYATQPDNLGAIGSPFGQAPRGRVRAIEVWTLESVEEGEEERPRVETEWRCRWYAPDGTQLDEYKSPWAHGSHPFALKHYPLTAGEVYPLVADVIDQQRSVNRLLTLIDHVIGTSAKGALLFPAEALPEGVSWDYITEQWARPDGVVLYQSTGMGKPEQLVTSKEPSSAYHLLELELKLMDRASGMSDALRGTATGANSRSAAIYESQLEASGIALRDTFAAFEAFRRERDRKATGM